MLEWTIPLYDNHTEPKYMQIYAYIKSEILKGGAPALSRLPSVRGLADNLGVSKNTVEAAYQQLIAEGYVESRAKKGLFVADWDQEELPLLPKLPAAGQRARSNRLGSVAATAGQSQPLLDFRHGSVDPDSFPLVLWRKFSNELFKTQLKEATTYGMQQGELRLREEIAAYLYPARGVVCTPDQIVIGAGIQQLLMRIVQLIGINGQTIAMEDPGYDGARIIFDSFNFKLSPIPLEPDGISMEVLEQSGAELVYVTPPYQFPCGIVMPLAKRRRLLQWAERQDAFIIEDDYNGEFKYGTKPIPALQGLDMNGRVVYLGTFSKTLLPSLRLSYMVLPPKLLARYTDRFALLEQTASKLHQLTLASFMGSGHWERHLRRLRKIYRRKHDVLVQSIGHQFGDEIRIISDRCGLHLTVEVRTTFSEAELVKSAMEHGVKVYPLSPYRMVQEDGYPRLLLGFAGLNEQQLKEGTARLKQAWDGGMHRRQMGE
ncbi:PLP-dependent aminotransferase family protein [Paenibacillus pinihumi]|uniref:MocR-like pyridoxine biosynthesis transcription factor PdxR n=1 Tax=Paenibacillus pinihumi TaxID=669462 RepID=UPI00040AD367|nr:PLP-dependent aminotransferase family protein [Paenibacillus pinihumi]